jgi:S1-C subfamily serine protease
MGSKQACEWTILLVLAVGGLCGCRARHTAQPGAPLSGTQIADRSRPATVEILVKYEAHGTVVLLQPDENRLLLALRAQSSPGQASAEEEYEKLINILYSDPASYLKEGQSQEVDKQFYSLGSGFIVSPDGYILTNAHVVEPDEEELKTAAVSSLNELVNSQAGALESEIESTHPGQSLDPEAKAKMRSVLLQQYANRSQFQFSRELGILMPYAHGGSRDEFHPLACSLAIAGQPTPGKDIAVLKMDGSDLPTMPLADSIAAGGVRSGADLIVMGYPGSVTVFPGFQPGSSVQPSLTIGHVSELKDMTGGWQVIQTDAVINHGNSGGPVFNNRGEVVGLATFQLVGTQGVNFAESIDLAWQFLNELHVHPRQSEFTRKYYQALEEYERPRHGHALRLFQTLAGAYPDISTPRDFITELSQGNAPSAQADLSAAQTRAHAPRGGILLAVFGLFLVAGLVVLVIINR